MKIAYITPDLGLSGGIRVIFEHCRRLRARGHETYLAALSGETAQGWYRGLGVPIVRLDDLPGLKPEVIFATGAETPHAVNALAEAGLAEAGLAARNFYLIQGQDAYFEPGNRERVDRGEATYRMRDFRPVCVSQFLADWLAADFGRDDAVVVRDGIDLEVFYPDPAFPATGHARVLIEGAAGQPMKGVEDSFAAVEPLDVEVWHLTADPTTPARTDRLWYRPDADTIRRVYSSSQIMIKMSRMEGAGLPQMEAMACGCAVVSTTAGGIPEYCADGETALLVEPGDIEGARAAVEQLLENSEFSGRLVRSALERAKRDFAWDDKIDALERILAE